MTDTAWPSFIMPEFTKPTTMTEVAEEDWITAAEPVQHQLHPVAGDALQAVPHQAHAEQEQRNATQQCKNI